MKNYTPYTIFAFIIHKTVYINSLIKQIKCRYNAIKTSINCKKLHNYVYIFVKILICYGSNYYAPPFKSTKQLYVSTRHKVKQSPCHRFMPKISIHLRRMLLACGINSIICCIYETICTINDTNCFNCGQSVPHLKQTVEQAIPSGKKRG